MTIMRLPTEVMQERLVRWFLARFLFPHSCLGIEHGTHYRIYLKICIRHVSLMLGPSSK